MAKMYASSAEKVRIWRENNPEAHRAHIASRDKDALRAAQKRWRDKNVQRERARASQWAKANPEAVALSASRRRAQHRLATPAWADNLLMRDIYKLASIYREYCFPVEVDHIVPLKSSTVCGLHTQANLQILPSVDNSRKGNHWWPDMPETHT